MLLVVCFFVGGLKRPPLPKLWLFTLVCRCPVTGTRWKAQCLWPHIALSPLQPPPFGQILLSSACRHVNDLRNVLSKAITGLACPRLTQASSSLSWRLKTYLPAIATTKDSKNSEKRRHSGSWEISNYPQRKTSLSHSLSWISGNIPYFSVALEAGNLGTLAFLLPSCWCPQ